MPSPFPGMDPYLEGSLWTTVHTSLTNEIVRQLAPKIRRKYVALPTEHFVVEEMEDVAIAMTSRSSDVAVVKTNGGTRGGAAAAVAQAPVRLTTIIPTAVPQVTIEIRDTANRQLVTAIEVLSPTNKRGEERREYLNKRRQILLSDAHLVEIDLLHEGRRVPMQQEWPAAPYFVIVGRAENRPFVEVRPIQLPEPLPGIPIPLLAGDADVPLDLQLALTTVYDTIGYDLAVDYSKPPEVQLPPEEAAWVRERLRAFRARSNP